MNKKDEKRTAKAFNDIITTCLGGSVGDPDSLQLEVAAIAFKTLVKLGFKIESEKDVRATLTGENVYECDFLE
jgi:hypothetical protein